MDSKVRIQSKTKQLVIRQSRRPRTAEGLVFGASEKTESCQIVGRCTSIEKWRVWGPGKSTGPTEVLYTLGLKSGFCSSGNDRAKRSVVRKHVTPGGASKKPKSTHAFEGREALGKRGSCG